MEIINKDVELQEVGEGNCGLCAGGCGVTIETGVIGAAVAMLAVFYVM